MSSAAATSDNNRGRDHTIGFRMSSDEDSNSIYIQEIDLEVIIETNVICSNFVLYENYSIINTKIVCITGRWSESSGG